MSITLGLSRHPNGLVFYRISECQLNRRPECRIGGLSIKRAFL
jgi:hypothetical protein